MVYYFRLKSLLLKFSNSENDEVVAKKQLPLVNSALSTKLTAAKQVPSNFPTAKESLELESVSRPSYIKSVTSVSPLTDVNPTLNVQNQTPFSIPSSNTSVEQIDNLEPENIPITPNMEQVTSVTQLTDVKPSDWAFEALRSLVERYGYIAGYPNGNFRGNQAMTRFEFAAGLNACMDQISRLVTTATADFVRKEDLEKLQRLQQEFSTELTTLGNRVNNLEARTTKFENQQFSTTTKLNGQVWFNLTGTFPTDDVTAERSLTAPGSAFAPPRRDANNQPTRVQRKQPQTTLSYYTFLTLTTSFTGKDSLVTQLVSGNGDSPANQLVSAGFFNSWGTPFLDQTGVPRAGSVAIRELSYTF
ncbi:MAG: iron uptake porin, partial [Coleofasciculaceae cyanobacterium]